MHVKIIKKYEEKLVVLYRFTNVSGRFRLRDKRMKKKIRYRAK